MSARARWQLDEADSEKGGTIGGEDSVCSSRREGSMRCVLLSWCWLNVVDETVPGGYNLRLAAPDQRTARPVERLAWADIQRLFQPASRAREC